MKDHDTHLVRACREAGWGPRRLRTLLAPVGFFPLWARAGWLHYDPDPARTRAGLQAVGDLQAAVDAGLSDPSCEGVVLHGDWNRALVVRGAREPGFVLDASAGDARVASRLHVDAGFQGELDVLGGWIGEAVDRPAAAGPFAAVDGGSVRFVGVAFKGVPVSPGEADDGRRTACGSLVAVDGSGGGSPRVELFDCLFDTRSLGSTDGGPVPLQAVFVREAGLAAVDARLPESGGRAFANGLIVAERSRVELERLRLDGLRCAPGATVLHPAPLLAAFGAWPGEADGPQVRLEDASVEACAGGEAGALWLEDVAGLRLARSRFAACDGWRAGVLFAAAAAPMELDLEDVVMAGPDAGADGPAIELHLRGRTGNRLSNLLVAGWSTGLALELEAGDGGETLLDGLTVDAPSAAVSVRRALSGLRLANCNLVGAGGLRCAGRETRNLALDCVNFDGAEADGVPEVACSRRVTRRASRFVGRGDAVGAFQLRWDSPLLDAGVATGPTEPEAFDFDLTPRDVGCKRRFQVVELDGRTLRDPPAGWYRLGSGGRARLVYGAALPAGTVIRAGEDAGLAIVGGVDGVFAVGDADGERTAIAPRSPGDPFDRAAWLEFAGRGGDLLEFRGALLNGVADELRFSNCRVRLAGGEGAEGLRFLFWGGGGGAPSLRFRDGVAGLVGFDFRRARGRWPLRRLEALRTRLQAIDCVFGEPAPGGSAVAVEGGGPGGLSLLSGCRFDGDGSSGVPLRLLDAAVRLEGCVFDDLRQPAVDAWLGSLFLDDGARNRFLGQASHLGPLELIRLRDAELELRGGGNGFVLPEILLGPEGRFVRADGWPTVGDGPPRDFGGNFWGESCHLPCLADARTPADVLVAPQLAACDDAPEPCEADPVRGQLDAALAAEADGDGRLAADLHAQLVREHPRHPLAWTSAQRLEVLGRQREAGLDAALFAELAAGLPECAEPLANVLTASAAAQLAWDGDLPGSRTALAALERVAASERELDAIRKHRLEIETYPAAKAQDGPWGEAAQRLLELRAGAPTGPARLRTLPAR